MAQHDLWPLQADDDRLPALLRLLGTLCGDGHLSRDGKAVSWYTAVAADAAAMADDVRRIGFAPSVLLLDLMRGVQGVAGAIALSAGFAALAQEFEGTARTRALGLIGSGFGIGIAFCPVIDGLL